MLRRRCDPGEAKRTTLSGKAATQTEPGGEPSSIAARRWANSSGVSAERMHTARSTPTSRGSPRAPTSSRPPRTHGCHEHPHPRRAKLPSAPTGRQGVGTSTPPAPGAGQTTNNTTLRQWVPAQADIDALWRATPAERTLEPAGDPLFAVRAAYQLPVEVTLPGAAAPNPVDRGDAERVVVFVDDLVAAIDQETEAQLADVAAV